MDLQNLCINKKHQSQKYKNKIMKNVRSKIFTAILAYVAPIAINYLMNRFLNKKSKPQVKSTL